MNKEPEPFKKTLLGHLGEIVANLDYACRRDAISSELLGQNSQALLKCRTAWLHAQEGEMSKALGILEEIVW